MLIISALLRLTGGVTGTHTIAYGPVVRTAHVSDACTAPHPPGANIQGSHLRKDTSLSALLEDLSKPPDVYYSCAHGFRSLVGTMLIWLLQRIIIGMRSLKWTDFLASL